MAAETSGNRGSSSTRSTAKSSAKKASSRKAPTKKSPTKKSAAKKTTAKKTTAKKTTAKKTSGGSRSSARAPRAEAPRRVSGSDIAEAAVRQLSELAGKEIEGVTGLERTDEGWRVELDVLELRRVPTTTDVLATYEVTVDSRGELEGYRRMHRYVRGAPAEDGA